MNFIRFFSILVITALLLFMPVKGFCQFEEVLVHPDKIELDFTKTGPEKRIISRIIYVENPTKKTLRVRGYTQNWDLAPSGSITFFEKPDEFSLSKYLKYNPKEFDLAPGQKQIIRLTANIPDEIKGELRSILFFETVTPKNQVLEKDNTRININVNFKARYGVVLYAYKGILSKQAEIVNLKYEFIDNKPNLIADIKNPGNIHCTVSGKYKLTPPDPNAKGIEGQTSNYTVLPGRTQSFKIPLPSAMMKKSNYKAELTFEYKNRENKIEAFTAVTDFNFNPQQNPVKSKLLNTTNPEETYKDSKNTAKPIKSGEPVDYNNIDTKEIKFKK